MLFVSIRAPEKICLKFLGIKISSYVEEKKNHFEKYLDL